MSKIRIRTVSRTLLYQNHRPPVSQNHQSAHVVGKVRRPKCKRRTDRGQSWIGHWSCEAWVAPGHSASAPRPSVSSPTSQEGLADVAKGSAQGGRRGGRRPSWWRQGFAAEWRLGWAGQRAQSAAASCTQPPMIITEFFAVL